MEKKQPSGQQLGERAPLGLKGAGKFWASGKSGHSLSLPEENIGPITLTILQAGMAVKIFMVTPKYF
jgi:hypothetical protein